VRKTSVYLDERLDRALARRAAQEGITKAQLIRVTLAGAVATATVARPRAIGLEDDLPAALARDDERFLADTGFGSWPSS
jgi:hypothetical protein